MLCTAESALPCTLPKGPLDLYNESTARFNLPGRRAFAFVTQPSAQARARENIESENPTLA